MREKALNTSRQEGGRLLIIKGASYDKTFTTAPRGERKTVRPGFARGKYTPSAAYGGVSPGGGDFPYAYL